MFSHLEADIAAHERRIATLRAESSIELARVHDRAHSALASPAAFAAAVGLGAVIGALTDRRQARTTTTPRGGLLLAATGILATLRQLAAVLPSTSVR